jgi:acyl carrier protein/GNAT superfamily N-acetyltransferase
MNRDLVEKEVVGTLRETSLGGSDRDINLADPLGELGLGLDSLALVQFVTALEKKFQTPIPDDIWTARGQLTLNHFVEILAQSPGVAPPPESSPPVAPAGKSKTPSPSRKKRRWEGWQLLKSLYTIRTRRYHILQFRLTEQPLPDYSPPLPLVMREATLDDAAALTAFWESSPGVTLNKEKMTLELFGSLLASGHTCYAAWLDDAIVGWDWIWEHGFRCRITGLRLDWPKDTCYAGELYEHKRHGGKGIGLALLAFSLRESKRKGYARQVFWVDARNRRMLSASMQLFKFEITGEIRRKGLFPMEWTPLEKFFTRLSFSSWKNNGREGRGTLVL